MNSYCLPYNRSKLCFELPKNIIPDIYTPKTIPAISNPAQSIKDQLKQFQNVAPGKFGNIHKNSVAIAINDNTRPVPYHHLLPPLMDWLFELGISSSDITFYVASGTHKALSHEEINHLLPDNVANNYAVLSHNCDIRGDLLFLGKTRLDTPVWINSKYYNSDIKIVIGNIEPHHFMGFSGGVKTASIGLAGRDTITQNHKMLLLPESKAGNYDTNPMRMDIEEIGEMIGIQLAINVILNEEKQILEVFAGTPKNVMKIGTEKIRNLMMTKLPALYDIVIASAGGYPKDINLYQAQKAMTHSSYFVKDGGVIILVAACSEGFGNLLFENFIRSVTNSEMIFQNFLQRPFEIGPHKALQIAKIKQRMEIILISEINPDIPAFLLNTSPTIEQALHQTGIFKRVGLRVAILPSATHTVPDI